MTHPDWPDNLPDLSRVRDWIASSLPGHPVVHGPTQVYAVYATPPDIRVTARFQVGPSCHTAAAGQPGQDVILRANFFPPHDRAAAVAALVARLCPDDVPPLLAWEERDGGWWMLCRPFEGEIIEDLKEVGALQETARTLARIQTAFVDAPENEMRRLPYITPRRIPGMFDAVLSNIREQYVTVWKSDAGPLTEALGFPAQDVSARLEPLSQQVVDWAGEFVRGSWPLAVDHGDLHAGNAVQLENGKVLIYDWENAVVGCPFFSLDKLLVSAWNLDSGSSGPWGFVVGTQSQSAVRNAYLNALPWSRRTSREHALDIALCMATVKEMYTEIAWAKTMGWKDDNPEWTAQLISRLFQYLSRL